MRVARGDKDNGIIVDPRSGGRASMMPQGSVSFDETSCFVRQTILLSQRLLMETVKVTVWAQSQNQTKTVVALVVGYTVE